MRRIIAAPSIARIVATRPNEGIRALSSSDLSELLLPPSSASSVPYGSGMLTSFELTASTESVAEITEATTTDASSEIDEKTTFSNNRKSFENPRAEKS